VKYQIAIFDFDGTLADSFPFFASIVNHLAERFSFRPIEEHEHERLRHYSAAQLITHVGLPVWKLPIIGAYYRSLMAQRIHEIRLFPGIDGVLRRLAAGGLTLAIVSSNSSDNVRHVLGPENAALVRFYECGVSIFGKQAKFARLLKRSGMRREEAIYIADELRDIDAARSARIAFGAVSWGYTAFAALTARHPEETFATVEEIAEKLG